MTADEKLAEFFNLITRVGIQALVMGGHAVRFYGIERTTVDYTCTCISRQPGRGFPHCSRSSSVPVG